MIIVTGEKQRVTREECGVFWRVSLFFL